MLHTILDTYDHCRLWPSHKSRTKLTTIDIFSFFTEMCKKIKTFLKFFSTHIEKIPSVCTECVETFRVTLDWQQCPFAILYLLCVIELNWSRWFREKERSHFIITSRQLMLSADHKAARWSLLNFSSPFRE